MSTYAWMKTDNALTITFKDGHSATILKDNTSFDTILDMIRGKADEASLRTATDAVARFKAEVGASLAGTGMVVVDRNGVTYKGQPVNGTVVNRLREHIADGLPTEPILAFMNKLYENPRQGAVESLYDFLEKNAVTITADGDFLAYKKVRDDYKDIYSGTILNRIGDKPEMLPWKVDEVRDNHCSSGLHVCSKDYLPSFGTSAGNRVMVVKVDPRSVVAVPRDYNFAKMRCFKYEVIAEITDQLTTDQINGYRVAALSPRESGGYDISDNYEEFARGGYDYDETVEADEGDDDIIATVDVYEDHEGRAYVLDTFGDRVYV